MYLITLILGCKMYVIHAMFWYKNLLSFHSETDIIISKWKEGEIHHNLCSVCTSKVCVDSRVDKSGDHLFYLPYFQTSFIG